MTIFAVLMPIPQLALEQRIQTEFPTDNLKITDTQWLISARGTAIDIVARLGIYDIAKPAEPPTGMAIVFATSSYYGRASTNVWDWIKAKLEASS